MKITVRFYDEDNVLLHEDDAKYYRRVQTKLISHEFYNFLQLFVGQYVAYNEVSEQLVGIGNTVPELKNSCNWYDGDCVYKFVGLEE